MDNSERKIINNLIVKIGKGSEQSLASLYERVGSRMLSVAIGITKDRQLAEDAVQESLIKIIKYARSFVKKDNGYGWICTIVRNESLGIIKKYKNIDANIDNFFNLSDFCSAHNNIQQKIDVESAINHLDKPDRYLIWLRYVCDMTIRDIASHISQPKSTIMYRLKKAEEILKKLLE